jgi:hypothetical protein
MADHQEPPARAGCQEGDCWAVDSPRLLCLVPFHPGVLQPALLDGPQLQRGSRDSHKLARWAVGQHGQGNDSLVVIIKVVQALRLLLHTLPGRDCWPGSRTELVDPGLAMLYLSTNDANIIQKNAGV